MIGEFLIVILMVGVICGFGTVVSICTLNLMCWVKRKVMSFKERERK
jgi:hypothetical protein